MKNRGRKRTRKKRRTKKKRRKRRARRSRSGHEGKNAERRGRAERGQRRTRAHLHRQQVGEDAGCEKKMRSLRESRVHKRHRSLRASCRRGAWHRLEKTQEQQAG
jgi:hypothetical protein